VSALSYLKKTGGGKNTPDFLAGHSLGEFNALCAAGCFDFETGLRLVRKRGELMSQSANGGMAAILNASRDEIESTLRSNGLTQIDLANYNTPTQIVISGALEEITRAQSLFMSGKVRYYPLNTSGAFHSRFMRAARDEFRAFLDTVSLAAPKIPVIANFTARPHVASELPDTLANQIASTVRWSESIQYLMGLGAAADPVNGMQFEEVGHGDVLTKLHFAIKQQTPKIVPVPASVDQPPAATAAHKVSAWNERHPVGTRVRSNTARYDELETRTPAVVLFGHRAAVYMKGYNGYFALDEISPL
jgi:malonyl CoA-acyl carrier protein transacylase